ncbi:MAG: DNA topoisomerase III [Clostridia bacterium]|nr:DNA topoisomerase III [Clostridia bacterium]
MGKTLILAEKPSVGRDIARALGVKGNAAAEGMIEGGEYVVSWAIGHLVALCDPDELSDEWKKWRMETLPMLPETLRTKVLPKTKKQFSILKKLLTSPEIDRVVCATDSGREGELIFRYIYHQAGCKKPVDRLWISSMTDAAIREGFAQMKPSSAYDGLYESARCRSEADWLIGMNASRAYTIKYGALLSVGRVQTPTLCLLVKRDQEIRSFVPQDYWEIRANFGDYEGLWVNPETGDTRCMDEARAHEIEAQVKGRPARVAEYEKELKRQLPPLLYDLTSLQREANKQLGLSAAQTLKIAQSLYEKHKLITYPRTDSRYLTHDMPEKVKKAIQSLTTEPCASLKQKVLSAPLIKSSRIYNDQKVSDHHAIIPTGRSMPSSLTAQEAAVFDMIARRLLAAHFPDYEYESAKATTVSEGHSFRSTGTRPVKLGWKEVYQDQQSKKKEVEQMLPELNVGDERTVKSVKVKAMKTKPPEPHTDATLLAAMENAGRTLDDETLRESMKDSGLGTPATRAAIIERLIEVGYARRKGKTIVSTEKGEKLISVAPDQLTSAELTGRWEKALAVMARETGREQMDQLSARFMDGIRKYASFLVDEARTKETEVEFEREERSKGKGRGKKTPAVKDLDVVCPICSQGHVTENSKAFSCSRWKEGCQMTIWKNCLESRGGPTLTAALVKLVIERREVAGSTGVIRYEPGQQPKFEKK